MEAITTERLCLRPFTQEDLGALAAVLGDVEVMRYSLIPPKSEAETQTALEVILAAYKQDGFGLFAMMYRTEARFIGYCGFARRIVDGRGEIEIGCGLTPAYWRMGLATEAMRVCRDYGFEKLGFERLISIVDPRNAASIRVAEKLGMQFERSSEFQGSPLHIYGITASNGVAR